MSDGSMWIPSTFRGQRVWAEATSGGEHVVRDGRVVFAYQQGSPKTYSTFPDRIQAEVGASTVRGPAAQAPTPSPSRSAPKKKASSGNQEIFGGTAADLADESMIHLWTDGACTGNPGPAGAGTVLLDGERRVELSTWLGQGTNNIAELTAILQGLQLLDDLDRPLVVHTDSQYCIGVLARGWKAKANAELIGEIRRVLRPARQVVWHWVRGHQGVELNERCDELARLGISKRADTRIG